MAELILASQSLARRQMLEAAGVRHVAIPARVDEEALAQSLAAAGASPRALADALAEAKAVKLSLLHPQALVLGADSVLALADGTRLEKPGTRDGLAEQLRLLRGRSHRLISAAVLARGGRAEWRHVAVATLKVRAFSDAFLADYVARVPDAVLGSVGGYHVEGLGIQLFEAIAGDLFTVRGLPLLPLLQQLRLTGYLAA
ncbi:MAG: nucleoside triphosphate pyrophosphatase [Sphingomonadaceae bacterium]